MSSETVPSPWETLNPQRFRHACSRFATGVAIVTVLDAAGDPHAMTVNSFTSVSLDPPLTLLCVDSRAGIYPMFGPGVLVAINVLREEQRDLSILFSRPGASRMYLTQWEAGATGAALIPGSLASFEGQVLRTVEAGDHIIVIMEVQAVASHTGLPLLYFDSRYQRIAHS